MNSVLYQAIHKLQKAVIKILLRKGIAFNEFMQVLKQSYIEVANEMLIESEGKATTSRIAILTGLTRKDVAQLRKSPIDYEHISPKYNRAARVISGWLEDREFCTEDGFPEVLSLNGKTQSFEALVNRYSGDMPMKAMLDELERVGVVKRIEKNHVSLQRRAYIPVGNEDQGIRFLGTDVAQLIETIDHNLNANTNNSNENLRFQRKVSYDNLPEDCLEEFQKIVRNDGQLLLEKLNTWLLERDCDNDSLPEGKIRKRAGVGMYYFEQDVQEPLQGHEKNEK